MKIHPQEVRRIKSQLYSQFAITASMHPCQPLIPFSSHSGMEWNSSCVEAYQQQDVPLLHWWRTQPMAEEHKYIKICTSDSRGFRKLNEGKLTVYGSYVGSTNLPFRKRRMASASLSERMTFCPVDLSSTVLLGSRDECSEAKTRYHIDAYGKQCLMKIQ